MNNVIGEQAWVSSHVWRSRIIDNSANPVTGLQPKDERFTHISVLSPTIRTCPWCKCERNCGHGIDFERGLLVHCTRVCIEDSRSGNSDSYCQNSTVCSFYGTASTEMIKTVELALRTCYCLLLFYLNSPAWFFCWKILQLPNISPSKFYANVNHIDLWHKRLGNILIEC